MLLKRMIIWIVALILCVIVIVHSIGRYGIKVQSKIEYKNPYSHDYVEANGTAISEALALFYSGKPVDPAMTAHVPSHVKRILELNPLSSDAIAHIAAKNMIDEGRFSESTYSLLTEAIKRNGRNRFALGTMLYGNITNGNLSEAFQEIETLVRLNPKKWKDYSFLIDYLYESPEYRIVMMKELEVNAPIWSYNFFVDKIPSLQVEDIDLWDETLRRFLLTNQKNTFSNSVRAQNFVHQIYPNRLVALGEYQRAYAFVRDAMSDDVSPSLIMNSQFEHVEKNHPFTWKLRSDKYVTSEYDPAGGLFVSFNSPKRDIVLSQYAVEQSRDPMMISFDYDFRADDRRGHFEWQLACAKSKEILFIHKIDEASSKNKGQYLSVPQRPVGCEFIHVTLSGVPGDYKSRISIMLNSIKIRKD